MGVPVIETDRLILRAHRLDDFPALEAMWADPRIARFIGGTWHFPNTVDTFHSAV